MNLFDLDDFSNYRSSNDMSSTTLSFLRQEQSTPHKLFLFIKPTVMCYLRGKQKRCCF